MRPVGVRDAAIDDLDDITRIYNWTIVDNHVSFDTEPFDRARRMDWWEARDPELPCLVAESDDHVLGVTYASWYRPKLGYRSTVETTIVLDTDHLRRGIGAQLLGTLLDRLATAGFHRAIAIVALPNEGSVGLHERLGYRNVGVLTEVGTKMGRKWDTMLLEYDLAAHSGARTEAP